MDNIVLPNSWTPFNPHDTQRLAWREKARFLGLDCGRGSGKTTMSKRKLVLAQAIKKPWPVKLFYGAPTQDQAMRIAWEDLLDLTPDEWIDKDRTVKGRLCTKFGSELRVVGLDKPQRLEGVQYDGGVIDESCDIRAKTFDLSIRPALSHRRGWCWRIGVPKRAGIGAHEFKEFCMRARAGTITNAAAYTWSSDGLVPQEDLDQAKETMDPKDFNEQFGGRWEKAGGGIFYAWDGEYNTRPCGYRPDIPIVVGSDFNVDPMAWVLCHQYPGPRLEMFDEIWLRDCNTDKALSVLHGRYADHKGGWEFYGDATGDSRHTSASESDYAKIYNDPRFKAMGRSVHYPSTNPSRKDRFSACNALVCNANERRRMYVDPRCENFLRDVVARAYKPGTMDPDDYGDVGHITDAWGYIVAGKFEVRIEIDLASPEVLIGANAIR